MQTQPVYGGEEAVVRKEDLVTLGRFSFALRWRIAGQAKGVTIHVFGPAAGRREEVLRFDCFDYPPHYHLGWSYRDEHYIAILDPDPLAWALNRIEMDLSNLLAATGADPMEPEELQDLKPLASALRRRADLLRQCGTT